MKEDLYNLILIREFIKSYTQENGLPSVRFYGILEDEDSRLWISTGKGLSVFDINNETFKNYKKNHGIRVLNSIMEHIVKAERVNYILVDRMV